MDRTIRVLFVPGRPWGFMKQSGTATQAATIFHILHKGNQEGIMKSRHLCSALALTASLLAAGCASRTVKPQQSYDKLQPIGVLPQASSEPTLIVQISNVADEGKSRKNSVELFVNDQEVQPSGGKSAGLHEYVYELALANGIYRIKAVYHARSPWRTKDFEINTHDGRVRIYPNYQTKLAVALDKRPDGTLKQKKNFFSEMPQSLIAVGTPAANKPVATPTATGSHDEVIRSTWGQQAQNKPEVIATPSRSTLPEAERSRPAPERGGKVALQINTTPSHAEVIVDDKYLGQSPLVTYVNREQNHVIQLSKEGYTGIIKLIDHRELEGLKVYFLIEKFEAQK
jgi:hypothetical protein